MSTNPNEVGGQQVDPNAPQLSLQAVYLKDCSYELPNGPRRPSSHNSTPSPYTSLDVVTAS